MATSLRQLQRTAGAGWVAGGQAEWLADRVFAFRLGEDSRSVATTVADLAGTPPRAR